MLNLAILVVVCGVAYRFRGGGILPDKEPSLLHSLRKPIYCLVTGGAFGLLAWDIWAGLIVGVSSLLPCLTSPRPLFWMWQNVYRAEEVKPNILNGWMHWLAAKWGTGKPTIYGLIYGSCRGLYELPMTIALAWYYHNPVIALWGLLGGLGMPVIYYASGKLVKDGATRAAECLYGACRGLILTGVLCICN